MKIVIVIDCWTEGNGAVISTKRMVQELTKRGHKIAIVTTGEYEGDFYSIPGFRPFFVRKALEYTDFQFAIGKKNILQEAFTGADLVQIQFPFILGRNAVRIATRMGIPVIGACHVQPQNIIAAMGRKESPFIEKVLYSFFNYSLFKHVDAIHCPSALAADMLRDHGCKADFKIISNGIPAEYHPVEHPRPDWFGDHFVVTNLGRHANEKRQELLIDGVIKSKYKDNIQLLLCGKGENTEKLKNLGAELPLKPLIEYVSEEDKLLYLNTSDIYLHPSAVDLESLSCLEAIGCGLPCVIGNSPHSAATQFALDDRFIFEKDNADALAEKIDYWYERRELLPKMKQKILQMAERYRFDKCIDEMEAFHKEIQGNGKKTHDIENSALI
jgi:glycosyltransferase involved in cell wall biosynthesis